MGTEDNEGREVELANVELREEMLRFCKQPDANRVTLGMLLLTTGKKAVVPVRRSELVSAKRLMFGSLFKAGNRLELFVYTSVLHIPVSCETDDVCFYPFMDLFTDIAEHGDVEILRIDPGTPHALLVHFMNGKPSLYSERRVHAHIK